MWGVVILHLNKTGSIESLLQIIAKSQSKIANISSNLTPNSKSLQLPSKGLGRSPSVEKLEVKNLVGLSL
jgi:hypothetical protein